MEALIRTIRWVKLIYRNAHKNDRVGIVGIYNAKYAHKNTKVGRYKQITSIQTIKVGEIHQQKPTQSHLHENPHFIPLSIPPLYLPLSSRFCAPPLFSHKHNDGAAKIIKPNTEKGE